MFDTLPIVILARVILSAPSALSISNTSILLLLSVTVSRPSAVAMCTSLPVPFISKIVIVLFPAAPSISKIALVPDCTEI